MIYEEVDSSTRRTLSQTTRELGTLKLDGPLVLGLAVIPFVAAAFALVDFFFAAMLSGAAAPAARARIRAMASGRGVGMQRVLGSDRGPSVAA